MQNVDWNYKCFEQAIESMNEDLIEYFVGISDGKLDYNKIDSDGNNYLWTIWRSGDGYEDYAQELKLMKYFIEELGVDPKHRNNADKNIAYQLRLMRDDKLREAMEYLEKLGVK